MTSGPPPSDRGLVTAPQAEAAFEGARVLDAGGNAADALVTAALVQGIVDPHRCGLGGFGCATVCFGQERLAIDFHGRVGSLARPDVWLDRFEAETPDGFGYLVAEKVNDVGYQSITVPGMVAGLAAIHSRFGTMPWRDLVERAVPWAEDGFWVSPELAEFWIRPGLYGRVSTRDRLGLTETGRRICFDAQGNTYRAGDLFRQPELARTYRRLAVEGPESFYRGDLAREILADWEAGGALVTADDLASYEPDIQAPVSSTLDDGLEILSTPLPGGGVALLQTLALAARLDATLEHNSVEWVHELARILRAVWNDRLTHQGDPSFCGRDAASFLTADWLDKLQEPGEAPPAAGADCSDTTQVSIVDGAGNAISFSHSLGYNSGVFAPELGILFNNCMSAFDPRPGRANSIAPGKARSTAVAETIVLRGGKPYLVLGSPGAARITAGLAQVLLNVLRFGMSVSEAVVHPRFDGYGDGGSVEQPGTLVVESRFPRPVTDALEARGWDLVRSPKPFGVVGRVYAAEVLQHDPIVVAAGVDPGAPGAAFRSSRRS